MKATSWHIMVCTAGNAVLQEQCQILVTILGDPNSCVMQWVAFLPPQHDISVQKDGPQIQFQKHIQQANTGTSLHSETCMIGDALLQEHYHVLGTT